MPSFFDSDDEDSSIPPRSNARRDRDSLPNHASSSRASASSPISNSSFADRMRSTVTPTRAGRSSSTGFTTVDGSSSTGIKRFDLGDLEEEDPSEGDTGGLNEFNGGDGLEDFEAYNFEDDNDVKRLIRAWMRERGTRDIMLWEGDLLDTILHKVEQQVRTVSPFPSSTSVG
jgi:hypothetical protein